MVYLFGSERSKNEKVLKRIFYFLSDSFFNFIFFFFWQTIFK